MPPPGVGVSMPGDGGSTGLVGLGGWNAGTGMGVLSPTGMGVLSPTGVGTGSSVPPTGVGTGSSVPIEGSVGKGVIGGCVSIAVGSGGSGRPPEGVGASVLLVPASMETAAADRRRRERSFIVVVW